MLGDWDERDDVVAAGSICPVPDCGALVVSYRPPERTGRDNARSWCEFTWHCGIDFSVLEDELIFQSRRAQHPFSSNSQLTNNLHKSCAHREFAPSA
jgi:hypothetical protein